MKTERILLGMAFASLFLFTTSLYAQQEVSPDWYDPWPADKAAAQALPPHTAVNPAAAKTPSVLPRLSAATPINTASLAGQLSKMPSHAMRSVSSKRVESSMHSNADVMATPSRRQATQAAEPTSGS